MKKIYPYVIFVIAIFLKNLTYAQCSSTTGATAGIGITPTGAWQTLSTSSGTYYTFNATYGARYVFTFCQSGGSATYDTQISINTSTGATIGGAYNDDNCGGGSELTFIPSATGTYRLFITEYTCANSGKTSTIAYRMLFNDNVCQAYYMSATNCTCTNIQYTTTGATSSPQAAPACGAYVANDVWIKTRVPFSGQMSIAATAGGITDGAMAAYTSSNNSCSGTLTVIGCDDDNGAGNMPQLNFTSLTPGDSVFIRFWAKNNAQSGTFSLCIQDLSPLFCMSGNATEMYPSKCVQITPNAPAQAGCVWNNSKINLAADFDYNFTVNLGSNDAGADGITFAMHDNASGTSACGTTGVGLGMGGITRSVTVEFDTFDNTGFPGYTEIAADHTAISLNGNIGTPVAGPVQASASSVNIEDGANHTVRIVWTQSTKLFQVYFDGSLRLSYTNDFVTNVFGGVSNVYWGMTGSTGAYYNQQSLCPGNLPGSPLPLTFFNGFLRNEKDIEFIWTYVNTHDVRKFTIEQSLNGTDFTQVYQNESITPAAYNRYAWTLSNANEGAYYRLIVDKNDGTQESSSVIYIDINQLQNTEYQIFPNPGQSGEMNIMSNESGDAEVIIRNVLGEVVSTNRISGVVNKLTLPDNMTNGSYIVTITTANKAYNYHYTLQR